MYSLYVRQLKSIEERADKASQLLEEYQELLDVTTDPRRKRQYLLEIERQQKLITDCEQEYNELQQKLNNSPSLQTPQLKSQFQQIDEKLNVVDEKLNFVIIEQSAILDDLQTTRQVLLNHYNSTEQRVIGAIAQQLNQSQLALTQKLIYALESNKLSEQQIQQMLASVEQRLPTLPASQAEPVAEIIQDPQIGVKHRLKVALPIIPMLLDWETEFELGSGVNLKSLWPQVIAKLGRKPQPKLIGNYSKLRQLLESEKWQEADLETGRIILAVAGREQQGWLRTKDMEKLSCSDLQIVDNLWKKFSQDKFGFTIQRKIWLEMMPLGKNFDHHLFPQFGERAGWFQGDRWLKYEQFNFSLQAPEGHLPSFPITCIIDQKVEPGTRQDNFRDLLSRLGTCFD